MFLLIFDVINVILSIILIGYGGYGYLITCGSDDYFLASIIFGVIWLIIDIFRIRRHRNNGNY